MKAMVLAAGLGTRMRPLSALLAKPVLPVLNRPLLHWTFDALRRAGVREVIVNLHHLPSTVRKALGDGRALGLPVSYSYEREILGTGGGPRRVRQRLGDEPVLIVNGDMLFDFDLRGLIRAHRDSGAVATLAVKRFPRGGAYAPIVVDRWHRVRWVRGMPGPPPAGSRRTLFTGLHVVDPMLFDRLPAGPSDSVADLYASLIHDGEARLKAWVTEGAWYDLGSPGRYWRAHRELLRSRFGRARAVHPEARIERGARVHDSAVGAGAVIQAGARVERSVLWPGAWVGAGALVRDAILASGARVSAGSSVVGVISARAVTALRSLPGCEIDGRQATFALRHRE